MAKEVTKEQLVKAVDNVLERIEMSRDKLILEGGLRLKRSPVDNLIEKAMFNGKSVMEEAEKIYNKVSKLSCSERMFIKSVILQACDDLSRQQIKTKNKDD